MVLSKYIYVERFRAYLTKLQHRFRTRPRVGSKPDMAGEVPGRKHVCQLGQRLSGSGSETGVEGENPSLTLQL